MMICACIKVCRLLMAALVERVSQHSLIGQRKAITAVVFNGENGRTDSSQVSGSL